MKVIHLSTIISLIAICFISSCSNPTNEVRKFKIIHSIKNNKNDSYIINPNIFKYNISNLPIGIFDSGTGGLTVLETILSSDQFNNDSHMPGSDGIPDFINESFIYLADEANMPYGRYCGEDKSDFLKELVIKDVAFLLGNSYYPNKLSEKAEKNKNSVKEIIIACNTATAFGFETAKSAIDTWNLPVNITGIIEAGARSAVEQLSDKNKQLIAVLATEGTVASEGYPKSIYKIADPNSDIEVIQKAGFGLAGAIDGDNNYIDIEASIPRSSSVYFGPDIYHSKYPIDLSLWDLYNFNTGSQLFIIRGEAGDTLNVQLNSVDNYTKYMVTNLVLDAYNNFPDRSIDAVILGCTHYPYIIDQIKNHITYLRYAKNEWSKIIPDSILFIDPSVSLAAQLYQNLKEKQIFGGNTHSESSFYISIPNLYEPDNIINSKGEFTFEWKYGRNINTDYQYVRIVPFSDEIISSTVMERIKLSLPNTYKIIK